MLTRLIVTGGAGFIGSSLVRRLLHTTEAHVTNVDKLTYAGNLDSLEEVDADRLRAWTRSMGRNAYADYVSALLDER